MSTSLRWQAGRKASFICPSCRARLETLSNPIRDNRRPQRRWITHNHVRNIKIAEDGWQERAKAIKDGRKRSILDLLEERGYVNQIVGTREDLNDLLVHRRVGVYAGIDPTAPSMHVGHMVPFMALAWMFIHGYSVNFLLGGATSRIGDPTDRLTGRDVQSKSTHNANVASMHMQLKRFGKTMETYGEARGYMREWAWRRALVNNATWYQKQTLTDFLRVMGTVVRIGPMLGRETVKNRLEKGDGMSFAEFTYPLVQAWDWWELFQKGVQVQIGGADQFGNILAGAEAVKQIAKRDAARQLEVQQMKSVAQGDAAMVTNDPLGFTVPLLTTAAGEKFGKSAGNAVWLDKDMTSVFDLYQFFLRSADADVEKYLKLLTFLPLAKIAETMDLHRQDESKRVAQHLLAKEFVELVHGKQEAEEAEAQHRQMFKKTLTISDIESSSKTAKSQATPEDSSERPKDLHPSLAKHAKPQSLHENASTHITLPHSLVFNTPLSRILFSAGLVASRSEGHRLIQNGGVYIGGRQGKGAMDDNLSYIPAIDSSWESVAKNIIDERVLILRTGKWRVKIVNIVPDADFEEAGLTCPGWDAERGQHVGVADTQDQQEEERLRTARADSQKPQKRDRGSKMAEKNHKVSRPQSR